jgi:hypothetical protein
MLKYIPAAALALVSLAFATPAHAHHVRPFVRVGPAVGVGAVRVGGVAFRGAAFGGVAVSRASFNYTSRRWFPSYGVYGYWSPAAATWYYWYPSQSVYLPFSSYAQYPVIVP